VVRAIKGQAVILRCTVAPGIDVKWIQVQKRDSQFFYIYTNGTIRYESLKSRYSVSDAATGNYTMTILDIQPNDAGRYFCLRGNFDEKPHFVTDNATHLLAAALKLYIVYVNGKKCLQFSTIITRLLLQLHIECCIQTLSIAFITATKIKSNQLYYSILNAIRCYEVQQLTRRTALYTLLASCLIYAWPLRPDR